MSTIGLRRLLSQHVSVNRLSTVTEVVSWMGAIQAQDLNSAKWAIGVRLPGATVQMVEDAISEGEIIRTHLMRPTWHIVSADDYLAILKLTAPNILSSLTSRRKQLELDETFFKKSNPALEWILRDGNHLTREELMKELSMTIPHIDSSRMNHILLQAELNGLICSGKIKDNQHSFALLEERFQARKIKREFNKSEALMLLAYKYFNSHGPATLNDFNWWSGLTMGDCRVALELVKDKLLSEKIDSATYWFTEPTEEMVLRENQLFLLPAFDEFIISYKDRSAVLKYEDSTKTVSSNGVFRPVIVYEGQVIGLWNKTLKKGKIEISTDYFIKPDKNIKEQVSEAGLDYALFTGTSSPKTNKAH